MAIKIPKNFNYKTILLDDLESKIRDELHIDISNWARFRHTINLGLNSSSLQSILPLSTEVKDCYIELGKSHYEVVTMLGAAKISLDNVMQFINSDRLLFKKAFKEFYMHTGSVIDNLARLIYIINIPTASTEKGKYKKKLQRHAIGYGDLKNLNSTHLKRYAQLIKSKKINEIKTVRNNFTHSWPPTIFQDSTTGQLFWPFAMRRREQYYLWPHDPDEIKKIKAKYRKKLLITKMISADWKALEKFQNTVFKYLVKDVPKFELNHNLTII